MNLNFPFLWNNYQNNNQIWVIYSLSNEPPGKGTLIGHTIKIIRKKCIHPSEESALLRPPSPQIVHLPTPQMSARRKTHLQGLPSYPASTHICASTCSQDCTVFERGMVNYRERAQDYWEWVEALFGQYWLLSGYFKLNQVSDRWEESKSQFFCVFGDFEWSLFDVQAQWR